MHQRASALSISSIPDAWLNTPIVHLGPVAQEIDPKLSRIFPKSLVGLTPQGWFRKTDNKRKVNFTEWPESNYVLGNATCAVISIDDVGGDESRIEDLISSIRILVVTEGAAGARLYWNGDLRRFLPPKMVETDPTGAGDIFAAAFFIRLYQTHNPWEAARFATHLAAQSVTRPGIEGIPQIDEIQSGIIQVIS
jgi:sugar/nucleoside kinase (ribokinase family)